MRLPLCALVFAVFVAVCDRTFAELFVYEPFVGYLDEETIVGQGPDALGFTGEWTGPSESFMTVAEGLEADGLSTPGGAVRFSDDIPQMARFFHRPLDLESPVLDGLGLQSGGPGTAIDQGVFYMSFLVRQDSDTQRS